MRGVPIVGPGAGPGYIAHTQPELQALSSLARLMEIAAKCQDSK
jgi:hypothetical protein